MWQITDMPIQVFRGGDYIGWLKFDDIQVKVQINPQYVSQEQAFLIIQNLAGIITCEGLARSLADGY